MGKRIKCSVCGASLSKNEIGLNKKLIDATSSKSCCLECLSAYLDTTVEDLQEKIEDFRSEGCTLFE